MTSLREQYDLLDTVTEEGMDHARFRKDDVYMSSSRKRRVKLTI